jgi:hypothetical protein
MAAFGRSRLFGQDAPADRRRRCLFLQPSADGRTYYARVTTSLEEREPWLRAGAGTGCCSSDKEVPHA